MKMSKITILILFLLLAACGDRPERYHNGIDPEFQQFFDEFTFDAGKHGRIISYDIAINFHEIPENGRCRHEAREILINKDVWEGIGLKERKALIYHELGHCLLGRDHDDEMMRIPGCACNASIMHPDMMSGFAFEMYEEEYIYELFTGDMTVWDSK